jgi:hypothetical protein
MDEVLCAALIDRRTAETTIALALKLDGKGSTRQHRYPLPGSHARALRAARRVRSGRRRLAISMSISITPWKISASPSARPCRRRSVTAAAQSRRLLRDADGRNPCWPPWISAAGPTVVNLKVAARRVGGCRPSSCDFFEGFAIGARANVHVSDVGRSSHHKIEAVFKAFARALRSRARGTSASPASCRQRKDCYELPIALIDYGAGNLTSVKKALAAVGADFRAGRLVRS